MAHRKPIFQLNADYDPTQFVTVRLTQTYADNQTIKRDVPTMDGTSIEAVLYCIREFDKIAGELEFTTADELYINFRRVLCGAAKDDWDSIATEVADRTPVTFLVNLDRWKSEMILPTARQTLVDYFESLVKPCQMTVEAFFNRLKVMVCYITDIPFPGPDPPSSVNNTKLKNIIFKAMPATWQTNSLRVNGDVLTATVLTLQQFMSQEREFTETANTRNQSNNFNTTGSKDNHPSQNSGNNRYAGRGGGRNNYAGSRHPNNNYNQRNTRPRITGRDTPCHPPAQRITSLVPMQAEPTFIQLSRPTTDWLIQSRWPLQRT
jgi:hypothetical protein